VEFAVFFTSVVKFVGVMKKLCFLNILYCSHHERFEKKMFSFEMSFVTFMLVKLRS